MPTDIEYSKLSTEKLRLLSLEIEGELSNRFFCPNVDVQRLSRIVSELAARLIEVEKKLNT